MHFRSPLAVCVTLEELAVFSSFLLPPSPPYESIEPSWGVYLMPAQEKKPLCLCE